MDPQYQLVVHRMHRKRTLKRKVRPQTARAVAHTEAATVRPGQQQVSEAQPIFAKAS